MGSETTVMFVDDEKSLADVYARQLEDAYDVRTAYSGREALEQINGVDVVFLDRRMPGLSGDEVLDEILDRDLDCRVAMLTGKELEFEESLGFDEYLMKPVTKETLVETVEKLVHPEFDYETI